MNKLLERVKNWETTVTGTVAIISIVVEYFLPEYAGIWNKVVATLAGVHLITARD